MWRGHSKGQNMLESVCELWRLYRHPCLQKYSRLSRNDSSPVPVSIRDCQDSCSRALRESARQPESCFLPCRRRATRAPSGPRRGCSELSLSHTETHLAYPEIMHVLREQVPFGDLQSRRQIRCVTATLHQYCRKM